MRLTNIERAGIVEGHHLRACPSPTERAVDLTLIENDDTSVHLVGCAVYLGNRGRPFLADERMNDIETLVDGIVNFEAPADEYCRMLQFDG